MNEGCKFLKKSCRLKKGPQKFLRIEGDFVPNFFRMLFENIFSQNFCPPIFVTQIFAPNIYDKSTPVAEECNFSIAEECNVMECNLPYWPNCRSRVAFR